MPHLRQLKLLYAVAYAVWLGYIAIKLFAGPSADHNPNLSGAIYCFLLLGGIPALGYILLFMVLPWVARSFRRA